MALYKDTRKKDAEAVVLKAELARALLDKKQEEQIRAAKRKISACEKAAKDAASAGSRADVEANLRLMSAHKADVARLQQAILSRQFQAMETRRARDGAAEADYQLLSTRALMAVNQSISVPALRASADRMQDVRSALADKQDALAEISAETMDAGMEYAAMAGADDGDDVDDFMEKEAARARQREALEISAMMDELMAPDISIPDGGGQSLATKKTLTPLEAFIQSQYEKEAKKGEQS